MAISPLVIDVHKSHGSPSEVMRSRSVHFGTAGLAALLLLLAAFVAFQPMLGGWFWRDDLPLLAVVRMLDNPFWLLVSDHMLGMPYYRPVGLIFWWLSAALFGDAALAHYLINLGLHAGVALLLWRLIVRVTGRLWLGFGAALLFAVHPLTISTSVWLSDRFDLLAALFGLQCLCTAWAYRLHGERRALVMTLVWLLLALGSKEVAFALVPSIAVIWLWPGGRASRTALLWLALAPALVLTARMLILGTFAAERLLGGRAIFDVLLQGLGSWFAMLPKYLAYAPYVGGVGLASLILGVLLLCAAAVWPHLRHGTVARSREVTRVNDKSGNDWCAVATGVTLLLSTCFVQWPMTGALPVRGPEVVVDSRYYYLAACGLVLAIGALLARCTAPPQRREWGMFALVGVALLALVLPWACASRQLATQFRQVSVHSKPLFDAAERALIDLPKPQPCRLFLLGTEDPDFADYLDAAIKATLAEELGLDRCLIQTRHAPWQYVLEGSTSKAASLPPFQPVMVDGEPYPRSKIGNVAILYQVLSKDVTPAQLPEARFLVWRNKQFVDITAQVRSGDYPVSFYCRRSPAQCGEQGVEVIQ